MSFGCNQCDSIFGDFYVKECIMDAYEGFGIVDEHTFNVGFELDRTILIGICCLFSILLQAQTEHFKFMGIPLDGKISAFDRELKKKGFEYHI